MAITLSKLYTRTGDDGTTALVDGERASKADLRLEVYGTADELNAWLGVLRAKAAASSQAAVRHRSAAWFSVLQNELFDIGSVLARRSDSGKPLPVGPDQVARLEADMDELTGQLTVLRSFVLPGGSELCASAHVARTVCRRFERLLVALHQKEPVPPVIREWVNRLSDFLFAYSRWVSQVEGTEEILWDIKK